MGNLIVGLIIRVLLFEICYGYHDMSFCALYVLILNRNVACGADVTCNRGICCSCYPGRLL